MSSLNYMELCRLCLVKERVSIPIFEGEGDVRQIFLKIAACLPVKVARDDKLPKKICGDCMFKLDNTYQFWNTTANAEKQLLQWLGEISSDDRKSVPSNTIETEQLVLKEEAVEQDQGSELAKSLSRVEAVLADDGRGGSEEEEEEEEDEETESEEEGSNSEDSGDDDGGEAPSKEEAESDEEPYEPLEPTTFVNVSLAGCDEAGPSGIQQEQQQQQQKKQQQGLQQGQPSSQPQQQTQPQSQFLTPGAPSTSTAAPASASGFSEDTSIEDIGVRGTGHMDITGFRMSEAPDGGRNQFYTFVPLAYVPSQSCFSDGNKPGNVRVVLPPQLNINARSDVEETQINTMSEASNSITKTETAACTNLKSSISVKLHESVKIFRCELCGKEYSSKCRLNKHAVSHKNDRPFVCKFCNKAYKRNYELTAHMKLHKGIKDHIVCDICGCTASTKQSLKLHKKRHLGEYNFKCEVCGKGCVSQYELEMHKQVHTGKSFKCDVCGVAFFYKGNLKIHIKNRHQVDDHTIPHFQCEICGSKYRLRQSLLGHMKTHTGYLCDFCGKAVSSQSSLRAHRRIHTGEKPVICNVCGKTFNTSSYLRVHMRMHTGERPHSCDLCGKTFTQRSSLVIHKRYHTGDRPYNCNICHKNFVTKTLMKTHQKCHDVSQ